jgi:hypothetical protein
MKINKKLPQIVAAGCITFELLTTKHYDVTTCRCAEKAWAEVKHSRKPPPKTQNKGKMLQEKNVTRSVCHFQHLQKGNLL